MTFDPSPDDEIAALAAARDLLRQQLASAAAAGVDPERVAQLLATTALLDAVETMLRAKRPIPAERALNPLQAQLVETLLASNPEQWWTPGALKQALGVSKTLSNDLLRLEEWGLVESAPDRTPRSKAALQGVASGSDIGVRKLLQGAQTRATRREHCRMFSGR